MNQELVNELLFHLNKVADVAEEMGIKNITQAGLIKEIIIADWMNHELVPGKHGADAVAKGNSNKKYEYLTCQDDNGFAMDDMNSRPYNMMEQSLNKILRNEYIYFARFTNGIRLDKIWEVKPEIVANKTKENLIKRDKNGTSKNNQHTVMYSQSWVNSVGVRVF